MTCKKKHIVFNPNIADIRVPVIFTKIINLILNC